MSKPLNEYQFSFEVGDSEHDEDSSNLFHITAQHNGGVVGYLGWAPSGKIGGVWVNQEHQGKGVADTMLEKGFLEHYTSGGEVPKPVHSSSLTDSGYRFAKRNWWAGQYKDPDFDGWGDPSPEDISYDIT